jgi:hypothetical protein
VTIQQALFIAPCSHAFHYKCLRPLLDTHYPAFVCPLCRTFADLEADVEVDADEWEEPDADALEGTSPGAKGTPLGDDDDAEMGEPEPEPELEGVLSDEEGEAFLAAMDALDAAGPSAMAGVESGSSDEHTGGEGTLAASKRKR